jgi:nucleoprotein TPR
MAATLDTAYVAKYTGWPQSNITTLLDAPTTETVTSFLQLILSRAKEHERLKADRLRIDVELENAVRGGEAKARALKAVNEQSLQQVEKLRTQLDEQGMAKSSTIRHFS